MEKTSTQRLTETVVLSAVGSKGKEVELRVEEGCWSFSPDLEGGEECATSMESKTHPLGVLRSL
jgi:hypothetical protein